MGGSGCSYVYDVFVSLWVGVAVAVCMYVCVMCVWVGVAVAMCMYM